MKRFFCILTAFAVVAFSSVSVFATDSFVELPVYEQGLSVTAGVACRVSSSGSTHYLCASHEGVYAFISYRNGQYFVDACTLFDNGEFYLYDAIDTLSSVFDTSDANIDSYRGNITYNSSAGTRFYYVELTGRNASSFGTVPAGINVYSSLLDGLDAVEDYIINGVTVPSTSSYTLPAGNVLYLDLHAGTNFDLTATARFPSVSNLVGSPFPDTAYTLTRNSLPDTSSSFRSSDGITVDWSKNPASSGNIFGLTKDAFASISGTTNLRYLVIVNQFSYYDTGHFNISPDMTIYGIPAGTSIYTFPLGTSLEGSSQVGNITTTAGGIGVASTSGGAIITNAIDNSDTIYTPVIGGSNEVDDAQTIGDYLNDIKQSLSDFFRNFLDVLSKPISHIRNLISNGTDFFNKISFLWSWLPPDVSAVITSALTVMVGVAVFKVFL